MPRRPRPLSRHDRISARAPVDKTLSLDVDLPKRPLPSGENLLEDEETQSEASESSDVENCDLETDGDEDSDLDVPRVAQWVDEDELEYSDGQKTGPSLHLESLKNGASIDSSSLPLGALRKSQNMFFPTSADNESNKGEGTDEESESEPQLMHEKGKERAKVEWSTRSRKDIAKRANKHAPMEVTSKRPVTRKRTVIEAKTPQERDPRFLPLAGQFSEDSFRHGYSFLAESHIRELDALRDNLKRARKLLASSPRDLYEERADEVQRLEQATKRAESLVNKDKRDKIEQGALAQVKKDELEKRKQGKGEWHMKKANKRELLMKARYDALAEEGGKRAVKKAIEKRQKKIGQKEKKSRPFVQDGAKRRRVV
ncbi:hypothetical protein C0992_001965 [Termitomyces sp. T32_za158]|nr:hypothetical protein C0992_001965 [Termitomyces sp. T32_za158]